MSQTITGTLKKSTGMNISTGPPASDEHTKVVEGPPGPEGGTPVVALPYNQWPPVDPVPDTLYLRLAP